MSIAGISSKNLSPHSFQPAAAVDALVEKASQAAQVSKSLPVFIKGMQKKAVNAGNDTLAKLANLAYAAMSDKGTDYQPAIAALLNGLPDQESFDAAKAQLLKYVTTSGNQKKFGSNEGLQHFIQAVQHEPPAPVQEPTPYEKAAELAKGSKSLPKVVEALQKKGASKEIAEQLATLVYAQMSDPAADYKPSITALLAQVPSKAAVYLIEYVQTPGNQKKFGQNEALVATLQTSPAAKTVEEAPTPSKTANSPAPLIVEESSAAPIGAPSPLSDSSIESADTAPAALEAPAEESSEPANDPIVQVDGAAQKQSACSKWVWVIPAVATAAAGAYYLYQMYSESMCGYRNPLEPFASNSTAPAAPSLPENFLSASGAVAREMFRTTSSLLDQPAASASDVVARTVANHAGETVLAVQAGIQSLGLAGLGVANLYRQPAQRTMAEEAMVRQTRSSRPRTKPVEQPAAKATPAPKVDSTPIQQPTLPVEQTAPAAANQVPQAILTARSAPTDQFSSAAPAANAVAVPGPSNGFTPIQQFELGVADVEQQALALSGSLTPAAWDSMKQTIFLRFDQLTEAVPEFTPDDWQGLLNSLSVRLERFEQDALKLPQPAETEVPTPQAAAAEEAPIFKNASASSDEVCPPQTNEDAAELAPKDLVSARPVDAPSLPTIARWNQQSFQRIFQTETQVADFMHTGICTASDALKETLAALPIPTADAPQETADAPQATLPAPEAAPAETIHIKLPKQEYKFRLQNLAISPDGYFCYAVNPRQCASITDTAGRRIPVMMNKYTGELLIPTALLRAFQA